MADRLGIVLSRRRMFAFCAVPAAAALTAGATRRAAGQPAPTAPLLKRPVPHSGEALPVIGLGTANGWDSGDDATARAARAGVIRGLVAAGAKIIDTAPSYGQAEGYVGDIVAEAGTRRDVFLATKLEEYDRRT